MSDEDQLVEMHTWGVIMLLGLSNVSRHGKKMVARCLESRLLQHLSTFTDDPVLFQDEMHSNSVVLAGDSALSFLKHAVHWVSSGITLHCTDQGFDQFCIAKLGGHIIHHISQVPAVVPYSLRHPLATNSSSALMNVVLSARDERRDA